MYESSLIGHIVRRGVECAHSMKKGEWEPPVWTQKEPVVGGSPHETSPLDDLFHKLRSPVAVITVVLTIGVILLIDFIINYSVGTIAVNLVITEDSEPNGAIKLPFNDSVNDPIAKSPLLGQGENPPAQDAPVKPITTSLCGTLRHIRSVGGFFSLFRGVLFGMFYKLVFMIFYGLLSVVFGILGTFGMVLASFAAAVLSCNLHAAWTHATIVAPSESSKPFFQRFLPRKTAKHLVLPTIRYLFAVNILAWATGFSTRLSVRLVKLDGLTPLAYLSFVNLVFVVLAIIFGLIIPAHMALIRTEASLLPADVPVIVPFDRTFGGRFDWEFASRKAYAFRNLTLRGACISFDRPAYKRVVKMLLKMMALVVTLWVLGGAILSAEMYAFVGKEAKALAIAMQNAN